MLRDNDEKKCGADLFTFYKPVCHFLTHFFKTKTA